MYAELPDLKSLALAVLYKTQWKSVDKTNDFIVKEALAAFTAKLADHDIGYFYDPDSPKDLCINPGMLVGRIANSRLPYNFSFHKGVQYLCKALNSIDNNDYNKLCVVVSDCLTQAEVEELVMELEKLKDVRYYVFSIGNSAVTKDVIGIKDALELENCLKDISLDT